MRLFFKSAINAFFVWMILDHPDWRNNKQIMRRTHERNVFSPIIRLFTVILQKKINFVSSRVTLDDTRMSGMKPPETILKSFLVASCELMICPHMIRPSGWGFPYNRDITQMTICSIALLRLFVDEDFDVVAFGSFWRH